MTMTTTTIVTCINCGARYDRDGPGNRGLWGSELLAETLDAYPIDMDDEVEYCHQCADEDVSQCEVLLEDDGRGYTLYYGPRYDEDTRTMVVCYSAGCRRFTRDQAIQHWGGGEYHPDRDAANRLLAAVLDHAPIEIGAEIGLGG